MCRTRALVLMVFTAVVCAIGAASSGVRAVDQPTRFGTIAGGGGVEFYDKEAGAENPLEHSGCQHDAECLAWLGSGCNPALSGRDPVLTTSIVDVGDLADGAPHVLSVRAPTIPPWGLYPGVVIQFWRRDCTEVQGAKLHSVGEKTTACEGFPLRDSGSCTFHIPGDATWMTLSGYATTVALSWSLE
jgi:hypothetical protein